MRLLSAVHPLALLTLWLLLCPSSIVGNTPAERAEKAFAQARGEYEGKSGDYTTAWQFARAAFDWGEFSKNNKQRETTALAGIAAARRAIELKPGSVEGHYYLGMNLGQLARTKSIGALKLVEEMEDLFKTARQFDENFDFAGPDRNLGLLYHEAPSFSVGDRKKARVHLERAVKLRPDYPDNQLNLVEAYLKWGDRTAASRQLAALRLNWEPAKKALTGDDWELAWTDWTRRLTAIERQLAP